MATGSLEYLPEYSKPEIHRLMLSDGVRIERYEQAIRRNIKKGDTVLDVGSGIGILAFFAVKCGAKKVYAVEPTGTIELAKKIAVRNGLEGKIDFIQRRVEDIDIPRVDCVVSEWMGLFGLQENILPSIAYARDNFLKPEGVLLPNQLSLYLALTEQEKQHQELTEKWKKVYGLDLRDFSDSLISVGCFLDISKEDLLSQPHKIKHLDIQKVDDVEFSTKNDLQVNRDGHCHGLCGWFKATFPSGIALDTSPISQLTHWKQAYFPIKEAIEVKKGQNVKVDFSTKISGNDKRLVHFVREVKC